jgi:hypothetical protein
MLIPLGDEKMALQLSLGRCSSCVIRRAGGARASAYWRVHT